MRLYNNRLSGNCWKVRQILAHRGIDYERVELDVIDRSNRKDVLGGKNPSLRVPTLELDDGTCLAESNAILWYLADGTEYLPDDPLERAQVLQWMFFEQYEVEPNIAVARFWLDILGERDEAKLEPKWAGGNRALAALDAHLDGRNWAVGDRYSAADISLSSYIQVAEDGEYDLSQFPNVQAWLARVGAVPGHVSMDD